MDITMYLVSVFCVIDDFLKGKQIRQRGVTPRLWDSEVLTMEVVGEFLGIDTDSGQYAYFRAHFGTFFPALLKVHRTTYVRQAANLWRIKEQLLSYVSNRVVFDPSLSIVDSFPVPVCRFARAYRCKRLAGWAAFGKDEVAKQTYFGLRVHMRVCWPGAIVQTSVTAANVHDLQALPDLLDNVHGQVLADRNYWSPRVRQELALSNITLIAPFRSAKRQKKPWPHWLTNMRRRIETVFSQLVERFHFKRLWARDTWHCASRFLRKLLSHAFAVYFCQQLDLFSLSFAQLISL